MVDLRTDVSCGVVNTNGVTIAVGAPNDDTTGIITKSTDCDAGALGSIALTPAGDIGGEVALRVVLGVNSQADTCTPTNQFGGCIVARRALRYAPHTMLSLPIDLDQDCLDHPCSADSTCIHGACTDAGVECDGSVCGIDAGPPQDSGADTGPPVDAGWCIESKPPPISSTSVAATPHIGRATQGYAIGWLSQPGAIYAEIVDQSGNIVVSARPIAQLGGTAKLDAIATDANDQNYFIVYEDGATLYAAVTPTAGGTVIANNIPSSTGALGAFRDSQSQLWVSGGTTGNTSSLYSFGTGMQTPFTTASATHFSIGRFGSRYYATTTEGTQCNLRTCDLQSSGAFTCLATPNVFTGCTSMRAAADASHVVVSYVANGTLTFNLIGGWAIQSGPVDDLDAMMPLVVGSTPYRLVWRSTGAILTNNFPNPGTAVTLDASGYTGAGAGFDAVADDPSQTGYAVVYWRAGAPATIEFRHLCQ
jgi:hypothetical protein